MALAFVFPGQGSQVTGMGRDLAAAFPAARETFQEVDEALKQKLSRLMFEGPPEELTLTANAQPALMAHSVAVLRVLEREGGFDLAARVALVAGHSLGEYTALVAAGVIDFPAALRVVRERGRLMKEAGDERPGGMAAVIGLDRDALEAVCVGAAVDGVVVVANDNCPGQSVISGELPALQRAMDLAKQAGAKRVARLGISIASHSPLMERASSELGDILAELPLRPPRIPVVANGSGRLMATVDEVRHELAHHVERPVDWTRSVRTMAAAGATTFVEVGPGQVLSGLIKRIDRSVVTVGLADLGLPTDEKPAPSR